MPSAKRAEIGDMSDCYLGDGWQVGFKDCLKIKKSDGDGIVVSVSLDEDKLEKAIQNIVKNMIELLFEDMLVSFTEDGVALTSENMKTSVDIKYDDVYIGIADEAKIVEVGKVFDMDISGYFAMGDLRGAGGKWNG